jgi:multidrug efflux pump subunit AcrA (membrane-fusion protein)
MKKIAKFEAQVQAAKAEADAARAKIDQLQAEQAKEIEPGAFDERALAIADAQKAQHLAGNKTKLAIEALELAKQDAAKAAYKASLGEIEHAAKDLRAIEGELFETLEKIYALTRAGIEANQHAMVARDQAKVIVGEHPELGFEVPQWTAQVAGARDGFGFVGNNPEARTVFAMLERYTGHTAQIASWLQRGKKLHRSKLTVDDMRNWGRLPLSVFEVRAPVSKKVEALACGEEDGNA